MINISGISKKYVINHQQEKYLALRDKIAGVFNFSNWTKLKSVRQEDFWALKDININVKNGEVLGIIGKNGAGKTTLLKLLSRITWPSLGEIRLQGRVASLLEVGTGFHPELTGRENIYFNGSILGMRKREIDKKFDAIVAFAEIEKFIDTPVKRYSSGMAVRLGFAVAAHLDSEILLIDEILSVGDLAFQKKSLKKMESVTGEGRTVIFISHNMGTVQRLCTRVVLLEGGRVAMDGITEKVIARYAGEGLAQMGQQIWSDKNKAPGNNVVRIHSLAVLDNKDKVCVHFDVRDAVKIEVKYWIFDSVEPQCVSVVFYDEMARVIFIARDNVSSPWKDKINPTGLYQSVCYIPGDLFNQGMVSVTVVVEPMDVIKRYPRPLVKDALIFYISDRFDPEGARGNYPFEWEAQAAVRPKLEWDVKKID